MNSTLGISCQNILLVTRLFKFHVLFPSLSLKGIDKTIGDALTDYDVVPVLIRHSETYNPDDTDCNSCIETVMRMTTADIRALAESKEIEENTLGSDIEFVRLS